MILMSIQALFSRATVTAPSLMTQAAASWIVVQRLYLSLVRHCKPNGPRGRSFAYGFNNADGGVFALLWDNSTGIAMWHFARADIPDDLTAQAPTPSTWGTPSGFWSAKTCDITDNFYEHQMVIDTTICGNWAGSDAYSSSGCSGKCTDMVADASNYVGKLRLDAHSFHNAQFSVVDAKWVINYVAVYQ
jgi:hypothetical protein